MPQTNVFAYFKAKAPAPGKVGSGLNQLEDRATDICQGTDTHPGPSDTLPLEQISVQSPTAGVEASSTSPPQTHPVSVLTMVLIILFPCG